MRLITLFSCVMFLGACQAEGVGSPDTLMVGPVRGTPAILEPDAGTMPDTRVAPDTGPLPDAMVAIDTRPDAKPPRDTLNLDGVTPQKRCNSEYVYSWLTACADLAAWASKCPTIANALAVNETIVENKNDSCMFVFCNNLNRTPAPTCMP